MEIRMAKQEDLPILFTMDHHIETDFLTRAVLEKRVFVAELAGIVGWLRYSYFWESIPFMDMLVVVEEQRHRGYGSKLVDYFEQYLKELGHTVVMTSTSAVENSQHLYYQLGYQAVGGFFPVDEPYELLLRKELSTNQKTGEQG